MDRTSWFRRESAYYRSTMPDDPKGERGNPLSQTETRKHMCNIEQLETHLTDLQKQIGRLFERKGIDPIHLFHLTIYATTEKVFDMIFEEMEEIDGEDYYEFKNLIMAEMERAFMDATNNQKRKRRIL